MPKIGIIRCQQTEEECSGEICFKASRQAKQAFKGMGKVEVVGFASCGGCPGKKAASRARIMKESGAKTIFFASCVARGTPNDFPCPFFAKMKKVVVKAIGPGIKVVDWTHD